MAVAIGALALVFALVRVQLIGREEYALIAKENRLRPLVIRAPRGTLYDRHGQVVAENVVGYQVLLMPGPVDSMRAGLARLRPVLGLSEEQAARAFRKWRRARHLPMEVDHDATPGAVARLQEQRNRFPGVLLYEYPKRHYPAGAALAHLVGYVAEISEQELAQPEFRDYRQGRWIGKAGLERAYERVIGGEPGVRYVEVDAMGRIKRLLPEESGVPPIPGRDLQLHLDLDLQRYVVELFRDAAKMYREEVRGGFVALEPATGGVLALYATPGYDPNLFVGGIDPDSWQALTRDPAKPLLDRATGAAQPPGSTWKLATAAMALRLGVIKPEDRMPIPCVGGMRYQRRYARCWYARGHGYQNLIGGIKHSCDVYFYQVGIRIGLKRFLELGTRLGFARPTGIDLPSEFPSSFPAGLEWWQKRFGYKPADNEIMSMAIGQGPITTTPLKLAQMYVAVARSDGKAPAPRLARTDEPVPITLDFGLSPEQIQIVRKGLRRVVGPGGTAQLTRLPGWDFFGKTGTSQNPHGADHAWFVGVGGPWGEEPEIVATMLLEHGEHGWAASGFVANAANFYLSRRHGRPFERYPVPRERVARGLPVDWAWLYSEVTDPPDAEPVAGAGGTTPTR
ncbi:MAG: penicillin-binding protein 2 [Gemmatimonadetes bacterium]|nr:penicillin-binding protein 2 [Gemmatimonadota bacterium]